MTQIGYLLQRYGVAALAATLASALLATGAQAQFFDGIYSAPVTSTTVNGPSSTETTGDSSVAPFENTTTTTTQQTVTSDMAPAHAALAVTINGKPYTGQVDYSASGGQAQTLEQSITNTYDPGPPPTLSGTIVNPDVITPVGSPVVTAISATGSIGNPDNFSATLSTSGPIDSNGNVVATEESWVMSSSGLTVSSRVGTASYDPSAGEVTVSLPTAPTSSTSITASGISTSGVMSANGFNANGNRITGVADGVAATDAVNVGQLNSAIDGVNTRLDGVNLRLDSLASDLRDLDKRANAGTAVAVAMSGGTFLPDKRFNLTANIGGYRGEAAIAGQLGILVNENVALNAGVAKGFSSRGGTAWRGGVSLGF